MTTITSTNTLIIKLLFIVGLLSSNAFAQEGLPIYTDYLTDNYYLIHPSMAGATDCSQVRITGRQNWSGVEDAPGLFTAAYNTKINTSSAIGANAFTDKNGFTSQRGVYLTYAQHINLSPNNKLKRLSFGISPGLLQYDLNRSTFGLVNDPILNEGLTNQIEFNLDIGISYHINNFYLIGTLKNVLKNQGFNASQNNLSDLRNLLISAGYTYKIRDTPFAIEPSILYSNRLVIDQSFADLNAKMYYDLPLGKLWGGLSYRLALDNQEINANTNSPISFQGLKQWSPFVGVNFRKFMVAYTYTAQSNNEVFANTGFHQITIGANFNCKIRKKKGKFNCYCPSVR